MGVRLMISESEWVFTIIWDSGWTWFWMVWILFWGTIAVWGSVRKMKEKEAKENDIEARISDLEKKMESLLNKSQNNT